MDGVRPCGVVQVVGSNILWGCHIQNTGIMLANSITVMMLTYQLLQCWSSNPTECVNLHIRR